MTAILDKSIKIDDFVMIEGKILVDRKVVSTGGEVIFKELY